ncbi:hypothetical protein D3C72_1766770 [compost metagenome]
MRMRIVKESGQRLREIHRKNDFTLMELEGRLIKKLTHSGRELLSVQTKPMRSALAHPIQKITRRHHQLKRIQIILPMGPLRVAIVY